MPEAPAETPVPDAPAVGAVEYADMGAIQDVVANEVRVWSDGNVVYVAGLDSEAVARVYNLMGGLVYEGVVANDVALELPVENGVYVIVVGKTTHKLVVR